EQRGTGVLCSGAAATLSQRVRRGPRRRVGACSPVCQWRMGMVVSGVAVTLTCRLSLMDAAWPTEDRGWAGWGAILVEDPESTEAVCIGQLGRGDSPRRWRMVEPWLGILGAGGGRRAPMGRP